METLRATLRSLPSERRAPDSWEYLTLPNNSPNRVFDTRESVSLFSIEHCLSYVLYFEGLSIVCFISFGITLTPIRLMPMTGLFLSV